MKCMFYLAVKWRYNWLDKRDTLYMTEFCWVACHLYMLYLILALGAAFGYDGLKKYTFSRTLFILYWGLANGAFAWATIIFKNAIVLHDLPNLASAFIHLTPTSLTWTMRWW